MTTLAVYRSQALDLLGDAAGERYTNAVLDAAIRQVLAEYNASSPYMDEAEHTIVVTSRSQPLTGLAGASINLISIVQVFYPYTTGQDSPTELNGWYEYSDSGTPSLNCSQLVPQTGEKFLIRYARGHTLKDFAGETDTTIPPGHQAFFLAGIAALAVYVRIAQTTEMHKSDPKQIKDLHILSNLLRKQWDTFIIRIRAASARRDGPLPSDNWGIDAWDC